MRIGSRAAPFPTNTIILATGRNAHCLSQKLKQTGFRTTVSENFQGRDSKPQKVQYPIRSGYSLGNLPESQHVQVGLPDLQAHCYLGQQYPTLPPVKEKDDARRMPASRHQVNPFRRFSAMQTRSTSPPLASFSQLRHAR